MMKHCLSITAYYACRPTMLFILGTISLLLLPACSFPVIPQDTQDVPQWEISANLYSGRVNPQGFLTVEQGSTLETMLAKLEAAPPVATGGLGYHGFMLRPSEPSTTDDILFITIHNGTAEVVRSDTTNYLLDPDRTLERWLFESALGSNWLSEGEEQMIDSELNNLEP